jgi:hypothetical protein
MVTAHASPLVHPLASEVSTTLTVGAGVAYEVFADAVEIPRWLPLVQTARVISRTREGRSAKVAFTRELERGSLCYTLDYRYDTTNFGVSWSTPASSGIVLSGEARFVPLSTKACMMLYRLVLDLPVVDESITNVLDRHPASLVVAEFREHLRRLC